MFTARLSHGTFSPTSLSIVEALWVVVLALFLTQPALGQNNQYTKNAPDQTSRSDTRIDPASHALSIQIPLGTYPGRAGLALPISITYSSKFRHLEANGEFQPPHGAMYYLYVDASDDRSKAGWTTSLAPARIEAVAEGYDGYFGLNIGQPGGLEHFIQTVARLRVIMGDGSSHELRRDDIPRIGASPNTPFYAVDGSQMLYDEASNTLFLPNGSRYKFNAGEATQYIDHNGNTLNFNGLWTDTVGRTFSSPLASSSVGDHQYLLPGVGGGSLTYVFRWRYLRDSATNETVLTDPSQELRYPGNYNCNIYNDGFQSLSPSLFTTSNPHTPICAIDKYNPVVLSEIVLPNGTSYRFTYNVWGEIDKLYSPDGAYERYQYAQIPPMTFMKQPFGVMNRAVTDRWVSSDGTPSSEVHWGYDVEFTAFNGNPYVTTITAPDGVVTKSYLHAQPDPYDGNSAHSVPYGFDDARAGRVYDTRVYSPTGQLQKRSLTQWTVSGPTPGGYSGATRNPRLTKQVEIEIDPDGTALAKATMHTYDLTYEFSIGPIETAVSEYDWVQVQQGTAQTASIDSFSPGTRLRTRETTNLILDASISQSVRDAYRARNLVGLPTSSRVRDGNNNIVAQSSVSYDETPLMSVGGVASWVDPQSDLRGNPTTASQWLNTTNSYVQTHSTFDQFGNVRTTMDANHNLSTIGYSSNFQYAYVSTTTTPVPDPSGVNGSNAAVSTSAEYDWNTGRVIATTDVNGVISTTEYADSLNRPTRSTRAVGDTIQNQSPLLYDDANRIVTGKADVVTFNDNRMKVESIFDGLGRTIESRQYESSTNYVAERTQFDAMGRPYMVSRPFRPWNNESPVWTVSSFDTRGRVVAVTTADGAQVTTAYALSVSGTPGNLVLVTDQKGRQRLSKTNALGQLTDIWEITTADGATGAVSFPGHPEVTAGYHTAYTYDVVGNLRAVTQGAQHRFYLYDSLSRLIRSRSPEQDVNGNLTPSLTDPITQNSAWSVAYAYDDNGNLVTKIDPRNITSHYSYDALNRNISVVYSNDPAATPSVSRFYDGWRNHVNNNIPNSKGRLWQIETSGEQASRTTIDTFDSMGRPLKQRQQFLANGAWSQNFTLRRTYDLSGQVLTQTYPSGHTVSYAYDTAGRTSSFVGNLGEGVPRTYATDLKYEPNGTLREERFGTEVPLYHKQRFNQRGQLWDMRLSYVSSVDPATSDLAAITNYYSTTFTPGGSGTDNNGNLLRQDIYLVGGSFFQDNFSYDPLNRLTAITERLNGSGSDTFRQSYSLDRWGNRTINQANTTPDLRSQLYVANATNNRLNTPDGMDPMTYDAAGNLIQDPKSKLPTADSQYDAENRVQSITVPYSPVCHPDGEGGQICQPVGADTYDYVYDGNGQRVRRNLNGGIAVSETWQVIGFDGELLAEYPQNQESVTISQPQKEYGYRAGQLLVIAEPWVNLALNKPATQTQNLNATTTADKAVNGDVNGNLFSGSASATNTGTNSWWQVDLQSVESIDNITVWGRTDCCPEMTTDFYVFVSDSPFTSTSLTKTLTQSGVTNYHYSGVAGPASVSVNRTGRYVRVQLAGTTSLVLGEVQVWGDAARVSWLVQDQLGTPRIIVGRSGSTDSIIRHDYLPFGEDVPEEFRDGVPGYNAGDNLRHKFSSKEHDDETDSYYYGARYYRSTMGRFTSVDPYNIVREAQITAQHDADKAAHQLAEYLSAPQQWNRYAFVGNNPLKYVDPTGELIELTGSTVEERNAALARLKAMVGREAGKHLSIGSEKGKDGKLHYYVKSDVKNLSDYGAGKLGKYVSELIDRKDHTVEFKIATSFDTKYRSGVLTGGDGSPCGGACTVGAEESKTGNTQIFVNEHASGYAEQEFRKPANGFKFSGGAFLHFEEDIVDAHEWGHAYANAIEGKPIHKSDATYDRAREWENLQRDTYKGWSARRTVE